jgi:hypothetical protein
MTHKSYSPRRIVRFLGWTFVALVLSAGATAAAPPTTPAAGQQVTRVAQAQTDPGARRQPVQDVSDALGQRLDRMMLDIKPVPTR